MDIKGSAVLKDGHKGLSPKWFLLAGGLLAGIFGIKLWSESEPQWLAGGILQALSAALVWKFYSEKELAWPKGADVSATPLKLFFSTFGCAFLGQYFFLQHHLAPALFLWAAALALFWGTGKAMGEAGGVAPTLEPSTFVERVLLGSLLLVAVAMRFPFIQMHLTGLQIDESNNILDAYNVMEGKIKSPFVTGWGGNETLHFWLLALFFKVFGTGYVPARAFSAVISVATLFVFFRWVHSFFSFTVSLSTTFLMSVGWWYLFYSLSPFQDMLVVFYEVTTFYFLTKALRDGRKLDFVWTGLFMALSVLEYLPGRLVLPMVVLSLAGIGFCEGREFWGKNGRNLLLTFLAFAWLAGPFLVFAVTNSEAFMSRTKELSLLNEVHRTHQVRLVFERLGWTLLSFVHRNPGADPRFCPPSDAQLDPVSGAMAVLGLVLLATHWRSRLAWFAFSGCLFGVVANAFAIQGPGCDMSYINGQRYFIIVPFLFLLVGWCLDRVMGFLRTLPGSFQWGARIALALFMGLAVYWNARIYYFSFRDLKNDGDGYWNQLAFSHVDLADYLKARAGQFNILLDWHIDSGTVQVLTRGKVTYNVLPDQMKVPFDFKTDRKLLVLFVPWNNQELMDRIRKAYPNAVWETVKNPWGNPEAISVVISREEIESKQKGIQLKDGFTWSQKS